MDERVNLTPQEIDQFAERIAEDQEEFRLRHILVAIPEAASAEAIAEAREEAEALRRELTDQGTDFAALAAARSDGRNALEGGDLGWRRAGELPSVIRRAPQRSEPRRDQRNPPHPLRIPPVQDGGPARRRAPYRHPDPGTSHPHRDQRGGQRPRCTASPRVPARAHRRRRILRRARPGQLDDDGNATASDGGDMGWLNPEEMAPGLPAAASPSSNPARSAAPSARAAGWHIGGGARAPRGGQPPSTYRRNQAAQQLRQRKEEEETELWLRQLREEAYVDYRLEELVSDAAV
ncbi:MAG: peptidylprolyl isomerase [Arhodomonas sp.]|nr:peptidylprolyl isomerase [Arhodomonas sp.]